MNSLPELATVYQAIYTLYNSPNSDEKAKASNWLEELQKSVFAWKISDEMLREKKDLESCCFAAQTMRRKIQYHFLELPTDAHESLKNSLMEHISQIDENTNHAIVTQLCLALADLALQMYFWQDPVVELINRFGGNSNTLWSLLEIIKVLPEEAKTLRLGANRREEVLKNLSTCADTVTEFLELCLKNNEKMEKIHVRILSCLTSWIMIQVIQVQKIPNNQVVAYAFQILRNNMVYPQLHETATDCVSAILHIIEVNHRHLSSKDKEASLHLQQLELCLFTSIITLEEPYYFSVAHEEIELSLNYCRIFTELAETFLMTIVKGCAEEKQHYALRILDLVLMCVAHYDWEVAQITFNFWYQLSEELYERNVDDLTVIFRPYIEKLIGSLCKHCQMEPDHLGLVEEGGAEFNQFRNRVSDLIKDVIFIVGSSYCFRQMFYKLTGTTGQQHVDGTNVQHQQPTWDIVEAALFVMQSVAKNIPEENKIVPQVVEAILNIPENTHIAVRYTSVLLLGELCEWINGHPESLEPVLNFLLMCLNENGLASAACGALNNICTACPEHMSNHFSGLLRIARCLDNFPISNDAAIGLLKGISIILARLPYNEIVNGIKELCWYQAKPLCDLIESNSTDTSKGSKNNPVYWLDRLTAIFRHTNPRIENINDVHPCRDIVTELWPVFSNLCNKYLNDSWIMERTCRCLRYAIRCISKSGVHLLESIVKQIVQLYSINTYSCFLYLGSILVDEYASDHECAAGFIQMLEAFIPPTFKILQEPNGLKNHPDTVDDLFRLCTRFLQRTPVTFLHSPGIISIVDCALMACSLEHKEANSSVMKFFYDLIHCGRSNDDRSDFTIRRQLVQNILRQKGQTLITNLLHASIFSLTSTMLQDVSDIFIELTLTDQSLMAAWLEEAIKSMPTENVGGSPTATPDQLLEFHYTILRTTDSSKAVTHALKNFARLFR